ncbi:MAG: hypothetical protein AMK73_01165 [Planctomycetes bacterium SM23_32]|nr:MAG: hypothetical protein AMK73_01165 [Planctomycetes bacterium SM23_32]
MMTGRLARAGVAFVLIATGTIPAALAQEAERMQLKRSDVVFMGPAPVEVYQQYGTTVVSWGGRPWGDTDDAVKWYLDRVRAAREMDIKYLPGAAFRTAFAHMIDHDPDFMDSVCRSLEGEPITVPWLWDHEHKGHPAYWFCTNAPGYRAYLKHQMVRAFEKGADGLHIDDYMGTSGAHWAGGGCFCRHCVAAFRDYLAKNADPEELRRLGVASLEGFDYGAFLRSQGVTAKDFRERASWNPERIPLSHAFLEFQRRAAVEWVAQYRLYCEEVAGRPLALCVNSAVTHPDELLIAPVVTFFSGEVPAEADSDKVSALPVWSFKLGDVVERPVACTASGQDWAYVKGMGRPGLVRAWIVQAYAFGHQFMPPVHQWCYSDAGETRWEEKGTHWYDPSPEEFAYLCRFVRENAGLFDGYEAVANVGLLYSEEAFRRWQRQAMDACGDLVHLNVPFRLVPAGGAGTDQRLTGEDLVGLKALVVTEPTLLDEDQQAVLDAAEARVVRWPDEERLRALAPPQAVVEGAGGVTVVARVKPGDSSAPFVCHLVNRNYLPDSDAMAVQRDLTLWLSRELCRRGVAAATLHAPRREPVSLEVAPAPGGFEVTIPELDLWAVLALGPR